MRYTPYTEAQIQSMNVLEEGIYPFQVLEVITTNKMNEPLVDKNGHDMARLKLSVLDNLNRERVVFTYITGDGAFAYKLRHFAKSLNMLAEYEDGTFNIYNSRGRSGIAEIVIKKGGFKNDGSGEMWPDRNDVKDFVPLLNANNVPSVNQVNASLELDEEIPF